MTMLYPYHSASISSKLVANAMGILRIKRKNSAFRGSAYEVVINWGSRKLPDEVKKCLVLNNPVSVRLASNKLAFFRHLAGTGLTPDFATTMEGARQMIAEGSAVCCRTKISSHEGRGLVLARSQDELVPAKLYTRYMEKKDEFRVHVIGDRVVEVRRKARTYSTPDSAVNWQVRSYRNGFIFARKGVPTGKKLRQLETAAVSVVGKLGLDFGAVDIVWHDGPDRPYVLEVNTAPGIEGSTVPVYAAALELAAEQRIKHEKGITYALST